MRKYFEPLRDEIRENKSFRVTYQALIIRLVGLALIFINQVLLARLMGAKGFGNYTVIFTALNFLAVFSMLGFDTSVLRFFPSFSASRQWSMMKGFLRFSRRTVLLFSVISAAAIFLFLLYTKKHFNMSFAERISFSEALFWAVLLLPFLTFIHYYSSVLRSLHKIKTSLMPFYIILPVTVSIVCLLYYHEHEQLKVDAALFIYLCCAIAVFIFIARRLKSELRPRIMGVSAEYALKPWLSVSFTIFIIGIITLAIKRLDVLFISYYYGNTHAGIYAVAAMISGFVPFGLSVVEYVFTPRISELFESRQYEKLQMMISNASKMILVITLPIAVIMIVFGKSVLQVFGTAFIASYLPLMILTAGQLVNALTGMVAAMMTMTGNQRLFLVVYVFAGLLNVLLNFLLVPSFGMTGAAIASSVSLASLNLVMYFIVRKKLGIYIADYSRIFRRKSDQS